MALERADGAGQIDRSLNATVPSVVIWRADLQARRAVTSSGQSVGEFLVDREEAIKLEDLDHPGYRSRIDYKT